MRDAILLPMILRARNSRLLIPSYSYKKIVLS